MAMRCSESSCPPIMLIHVGAGFREPDPKRREARAESLRAVGESAWVEIEAGQAAVQAVSAIVAQLEASPLFNAGLGAVLQSDGLARLSAALMDGKRQKFSGVMSATHLCHPSRLVLALQERPESVLGPLGAQLLARELGIPPENPATPEQARRWIEQLAGSQKSQEGSGTVGAVVLDCRGRLAAATSTGGGRGNSPERISDSATVAGNYASAWAAISCTGIGEEIVDDGLAVRLETRVRDGLSIIEASERTYREAITRGRHYGWIGVDCHAAWMLCHTTEAMGAVAMHAGRSTLFIT